MSTATALATLPPGLVWQARQLAQQQGPVLPTGHAALDAELPGGGWPGAGIIELLHDHPGIGELSLLLPVLCQGASRRWQAWICPPWQPYAPALQAAGIDLDAVLLITPDNPAAALWACRQTLASGNCSAVLAWLPRIDNTGLRRLQLAAEDGATPLFLFRSRNSARQPSPAPLRLALSGANGQLRIDIVKRRGPLSHRPVLLPYASLMHGSSCAG